MDNSRILDFIKQRTPEELIRNLSESLHAAYARAHTLASEEMEVLRPDGLRGQMRFWFCNDEMAKAGKPMDTNPKGGQYGLVLLQNLTLIVFCVDHNKRARKTKYKSELALMNDMLEPKISDMFNPDSDSIHHALHACLMVINPGQHEDPIKPRDVQLVVPYTDLNGFHLSISINQWLESYKEESHVISDPWPTFRQEIIEIEKNNKNSK